MLDFPVFRVFDFSDYYSSMKDKQPIFYVSSSYNFTIFQLTHKNWLWVEGISNIRSYHFTGKKYLHNKKIKLLLPTFMSPILIILYSIGSWKTYGLFIWKYMLDFSLFWVVTSVCYYLSMKDEYKTFYVRSSCFSQHLNWQIKTNKRWEKQPTFYFGFPLGEIISR